MSHPTLDNLFGPRVKIERIKQLLESAELNTKKLRLKDEFVDAVKRVSSRSLWTVLLCDSLGLTHRLAARRKRTVVARVHRSVHG